MRLILTLRGVNVVDLELQLPIRRQEAPAPSLEAAAQSADLSRAEPYGDPATIAGFGFIARKGDP